MNSYVKEVLKLRGIFTTLKSVELKIDDLDYLNKYSAAIHMDYLTTDHLLAAYGFMNYQRIDNHHIVTSALAIRKITEGKYDLHHLDSIITKYGLDRNWVAGIVAHYAPTVNYDCAAVANYVAQSQPLQQRLENAFIQTIADLSDSHVEPYFGYVVQKELIAYLI